MLMRYTLQRVIQAMLTPPYDTFDDACLSVMPYAAALLFITLQRCLMLLPC